MKTKKKSTTALSLSLSYFFPLSSHLSHLLLLCFSYENKAVPQMHTSVLETKIANKCKLYFSFRELSHEKRQHRQKQKKKKIKQKKKQLSSMNIIFLGHGNKQCSATNAD